jgi:hypothetical protein
MTNFYLGADIGKLEYPRLIADENGWLPGGQRVGRHEVVVSRAGGRAG